MPTSTALPTAKPPVDPARLAAIKALPEAIGNDTMAEALARDTTLTVAAAGKVMRDLYAVQAKDRAEASQATWDGINAAVGAKEGAISSASAADPLRADQLACSASLEAERRRVARMTLDQRRAYANAKWGTGAPAEATAVEKGWDSAIDQVNKERGPAGR